MKKIFLILAFSLFLNLAVSWTSAETLESILSEPWAPRLKTPIAGFVPHGGEWTLSDGIIEGPAGNGFRLTKADIEKENVTFSAEIFLEKGRSGNAALVTNCGREGVGADAFDGYEFALYAKEQFVMLGRHQQNFRWLKSVPCTIPENEWVELKAECRRTKAGNLLTLSVNGRKTAEFIDPDPLPPGSVSLRPWQRTARFRNLKIDGERQVLASCPKETSVLPETLRSEDLPPILVVSRAAFGRPPAVGQDFWASRILKPGCALKIVHPSAPKREVETIFEDPKGTIYDANLSFDAKTVYFSYDPNGGNRWKIFRIGIDGSGLKQLTFGDFYDFSPAELPNGEIVFVSSRRGGFTLCQPGPTSNLHKMKADGSEIQCISMNTLSDFHPQVLPDGRILFTRWEYVDRDLTYRQSLWTQDPDGTNYQLYFGNTVRSCGSFLQSRPLPGSSTQLVSCFTPHHGYPQGAIGLIDPSFGREAPENVGYTYVTKELAPVRDRNHEWGYRDPFPISTDRFLCSFGSERNGSARYRLYLLDRNGEKRLLYEDPDPSMGIYCPLAIRETPRPREVSSTISDPSRSTGTLLLVNVYEGLAPFVKPGQVAKLRIMEQVRKSEDLGERAYDQSPLMSGATYYAKRCWGEVPVEKDGSAHFEVPALREIYLQALDSEGRELQRMTSALQVMPGEVQSCVGCHEDRQKSPLSLMRGVQPMAAQRAPDVPKMPEWWNEIEPANEKLDPRILNYSTLVQPVWDRWCIECHSGTDPDGGCDLTGDKTRFFSQSYDNLVFRSRSYRQHDMFSGRMLPEEAKREKPLVHFYWLLWTPSGVSQPLEAGILASRLEDYMTKEHCGHEMPLADRQRVFMWVDANIPYYATYASSRPRTFGKRDLFACEPFLTDFYDVWNRRCAKCHQEFHHSDAPTGPAPPTTNWSGRFGWVNFTTPEHSAALTAHRPKPLGRGIRTDDGFLFETETDPDYQKLLRAIRFGREAMLAEPRADMPGFRNAKEED